MTDYRVLPTPLGALMICGDREGLTKVEFCDEELNSEPVSNPLIDRAVAQLEEYFDGQRRTFDLPLKPDGSEFQHRVWKQLQAVGCGDTASYGAIAVAVGKPTASRAVGAANGRNPIAIIVPCHRIIGSNGTLTGYAGGLDRKRWLLAHEQRMTNVDFEYRKDKGSILRNPPV